jgi:very-short-patch-repair endonuclease
MAGVALPSLALAESQQRVHVLVPGHEVRRPRRPEIVTHRRARHCNGLVYPATGILTTALSHSWVDAVRHLGRANGWQPPAEVPAAARGRFTAGANRILLEAVQLGDALMQRNKPKIKMPELAACVKVAQGPGSKLVQTAFGLVRPGTDSLMETWLRLAVWDAGFPDPEVNHELWIDQHHFFLDLAWPARKIAVEYQGRQHFQDERQAFDDMVRRGFFQQAGWTIVEAAHKDLLEPSDLLARLAQAFGW